AHRGGLSVALVEHELLGGECSYWACIPSKALLRPVQLYDQARTMPGVREAVTGPLDAGAVLKRRDWFASVDPSKPYGHDDAGQQSWLAGAGVAFVRGHGQLAGPRTVQVTAPNGETSTLTANHAVVLATGTLATVPPVPGLREAHPWTSRDVTNAEKAPRRLIVLGGGVVGCEMAQAMRGLGAEQVTIVERAPRLLSNTEPAASELLRTSSEEAGITVLTGREATEVRRPPRSRSSSTTAARSSVTSCSSPPAARRPATRSGWRRSASSRGSTSPSTTRCTSSAAGCTRAVTSPGGTCSPTWASTRPGWLVT